MGERLFEFVCGEFYHLYNRGTDKRVIYNDAYDYKRFVELLYLCNSTTAINVRNIYRDFTSAFDYDRGQQLIAIGAYCLMPNHFHILAIPYTDEGLSTFMNKLGTSYSMYFNIKYNRTGSLFEGKFKAQFVDTDEYLKYLYAYIHLNPVKLIQPDWKEVGINNRRVAYNYVASYKYSSLPDYLEVKRQSSVILEPNNFPQYFASSTDHKRELFEWLNYQDFITSKGKP